MNSYPDEANHDDYDYDPKPMLLIPPVTEHEFNTRFYACHQPRRLLHWYHKCKKLGVHSREVMHLLPKKKTELLEEGDKREFFWAIYAREKISFRRALVYFVICILPMLVFFITWIVPEGRRSDLQNASVPFMITISLLCLILGPALR